MAALGKKWILNRTRKLTIGGISQRKQKGVWGVFGALVTEVGLTWLVTDSGGELFCRAADKPN